MDAAEYLKQRKRMCDYESGERFCNNCPFEKILLPLMKVRNCNIVDELYPEQAIKLVQEWAKTHPKLPTWNEWLHGIYDYYNGFGYQSFVEWLNTSIPDDAIKHFNIPTMLGNESEDV